MKIEKKITRRKQEGSPTILRKGGPMKDRTKYSRKPKRREPWQK